MKAVGKINPFTLEQLIYVFDETDDSPKTYKIKLEELTDFLSNQENNIDEVHLVGQKDYLEKYAQEIKENGLSKYNKNIKVFINE